MDISFNNVGVSNFKVRRQKFGIGSLIFLLLFGAIMTGVSFLIYRTTQIDPSWTRVQGKVTDVSSSISDGSILYSPVITYTVDGSTHRITGGSSSSAYPNIGSTREVAYNPARPDQAKAVSGTGIKLFTLLFPVIGIGLMVLAPILFVRSLRRSSRINGLVQTGNKLQGVLVDIQSGGSNGSNSSSYKIVVAATDSSGAVQNYVSDSLSGIAGLAMADFRNNPIPIDVYLDPTNPQNYYVDISDIPNLTPDRIRDLIATAASRMQSRSIASGPPQPNPITAAPLGFGTAPTAPQQPASQNNPPYPPQSPPTV